MDSEVLHNWFASMVLCLPQGGKTKAAKTLGIDPSAFSRLIKRPDGFDTKTLRCMAWMMTSKAENFDVAAFPIVGDPVAVNGIVVETRMAPGGEKFQVWRKE